MFTSTHNKRKQSEPLTADPELAQAEPHRPEGIKLQHLELIVVQAEDAQRPGKRPVHRYGAQPVVAQVNGPETGAQRNEGPPAVLLLQTGQLVATEAEHAQLGRIGQQVKAGEADDLTADQTDDGQVGAGEVLRQYVELPVHRRRLLLLIFATVFSIVRRRVGHQRQSNSFQVEDRQEVAVNGDRVEQVDVDVAVAQVEVPHSTGKGGCFRCRR